MSGFADLKYRPSVVAQLAYTVDAGARFETCSGSGLGEKREGFHGNLSDMAP